VFEAFFEALAAMSRIAHLMQMFDSTAVRPHLGCECKGGRMVRRSRGGFSTKIHLKVDPEGLPLAFYLAGGEAGDPSPSSRGIGTLSIFPNKSDATKPNAAPNTISNMIIR
jgi:hypothetical protein